MNQHIPDPANVPGDFYVEADCCTSCGVPPQESPSLFAWKEDQNGCFVKKQPETADELAQMFMVIRCAELNCIRYRGNNWNIQSHLVELDEGRQCDTLPPGLDVRMKDREAIRRKALGWWSRFLLWSNGFSF